MENDKYVLVGGEMDYTEWRHIFKLDPAKRDRCRIIGKGL